MRTLSVTGEPGDWKLFLFSQTERLVWRRLPATFRRFLSTVLFGIAPAIPTDLIEFLRPNRRRNAFLFSACVTFVAGFVVQLLWSVKANTFLGSDPTRLYFSRDLTNLINFSVVCPVYVGLCSIMFMLVTGYWFHLKRIPHLLGEPAESTPSLSIAATITLALAVSAISTCKYIAECLSPSVYQRTPWYITTVAPDGKRLLGAFGIYYTLLIFCLFVVVVLALLAFLSLFALAVRVAAAIRRRPAVKSLDFQKLKDSLEGFLLAYIVMKLLVAVLIVNFYTWQWEQPRGSFMIISMGIALSFFGVFIVSLPRYVLELEWFRFKVKNAIALGWAVEQLDTDDLRPVLIRVGAGLLDALFIGNFVLSFVRVVRW